MSTAEQGLTLTRKVFKPVESHFTPGERSMVAWLTMDCVDHERDVVISAGVDYKTYFESNPVVLAVHDHGRWPLGKCAWIQAKKNDGFNGLYAKTILDADEEAEKVWGKIRSGSLKGISIGFRPPDDLKLGEWGPPTREELAKRPDWKGAERIIRRCVLLEYSVCSLPMNPRALVDAVNKGVHRPVYSLPKANTMDESTPEVEPADDEKACECGKEKCDECSERMRKKAEDEGDDKDTDARPSDTKALAEGTDDDFDEEDESALPIKTRDHVDVKAKGFRGCGMVEKIHRKGLVDHVDEDVVGTRDDPAARVRLYKAHGDGHVPTERKMGVKLSALSKREPFKTPSKKSVAEIETKTLEPLPEIHVQSDQEVRAELVAKLNAMLSPEGLRKMVREETCRITGVV